MGDWSQNIENLAFQVAAGKPHELSKGACYLAMFNGEPAILSYGPHFVIAYRMAKDPFASHHDWAVNEEKSTATTNNHRAAVKRGLELAGYRATDTEAPTIGMNVDGPFTVYRHKDWSRQENDPVTALTEVIEQAKAIGRVEQLDEDPAHHGVSAHLPRMESELFDVVGKFWTLENQMVLRTTKSARSGGLFLGSLERQYLINLLVYAKGQIEDGRGHWVDDPQVSENAAAVQALIDEICRQTGMKVSH